MKAIVQNESSSSNMKYHRVVVTRHGGPDVLQVVEEDLPEPRTGEVRVKVLAADHSPHPAAGISAQAHSRRQAGAFGPGSREGQRLVPRDAGGTP